MSKFHEALQQLRSVQKPSRGVSVYSRYLNRPMGRHLAALAHALGASPDMVTAASMVTTLVGLVFVVASVQVAWLSVVGGLLLVLGFALDSADGQLARLSGRSSVSGEWLDHVVDAGKMVCVHGAVLVSWLMHDDIAEAWYAAPLVFQVVGVVMFVGGTLVPLLRRGAPASVGRPSLARGLGLLPADYGLLCVVMMLAGWPGVFLPAYVFLAAANTILLVLLLTKWWSELRSVPST